MIIVVLAVLGAVFGSFVNAMVWRLHEQSTLAGKQGKAAEKRRQELSIAKGRSMCPHCSHELAPRDLVPVVSWLWLRGRCRYCPKPISAQYPVVEALTAALLVISYIWWPLSFQGADLFQFILWLGFVVAFVALAVYDLRWFLLPNRIVFPLMALAITEVIVAAIWQHDWHFGVNAAAGGLIISGIFYVLFQLSAGNWIGGGDVKLAVVLGLLAGTPLKSLLVLFFASVFGTIFSVPLLMRGKQNLRAKVPFGPFLLAATFVVVLFGSSMVNWYDGLLH